jgi:hypothetical protein
MNLQSKTIRQLKTMLKEIKSTSMGVKDIMLMHAIEDEIAKRSPK